MDLSYKNDNEYLLCEKKYACEATGEKVKKLRKYKFTSVFSCAAKNDQQTKQWKRKQIGLVENETSLLDILKVNTSECDEDLDNINIDDIATNQQNYLKSGDCLLLENILNGLQRKNAQKWESVTLDELFSEYLINGQVLVKETNLKEIAIILLELRCISGRIWHTNDMLKAEKVNVIVKAFGGTHFTEVKQCSKKIHNPDLLILCCMNVIKGNDFPVEHIQIPLASLLQIELRSKWCENATVPLTCHVPGGDINFFLYPEFNILHGQVEFRTFDFTHILTNLRTQILTRGLEYCKKEHFKHLSEHRPNILSLSLVFDRIDQQNASTAMWMFNEKVESYMCSAGFTEMAEFVKLIWNWHDACNKRGLPADTRVTYLHDIHNFLTCSINFNAIPFQYPGRYIKGLTWQTFEALLQNIST